jgi:hypothetical protein
MIIRPDESTWMPWEEATYHRAIARAVEAMALGLAGQALIRHPDYRVKGIGSLMTRIHEARIQWGVGVAKTEAPPTDEEAHAHRQMVRALAHILNPTVDGDAAIEELHSAVYSIDRALRIQGTAGPGSLRDLARGR